MENPKFKLNIDTVNEREPIISIREGRLPELLPDLEPKKIDIQGTIDAPKKFIQKRIKDKETWRQLSSHVLVDREKVSIKLIMNETDARWTGSVKGTLELHPKFKEFKINSGEGWEPNELGQFLKMNRAFFADKQVNMELVTKLKNFDATVNSKIEQQKEDKGSFKDNYSAVVQSNLPDAFQAQIPIFKGLPAEDLEVEFYATVSGREVTIQLISPGANQVLEEVRDQVIDQEIEVIEQLCPDLVIIEQ